MRAKRELNNPDDEGEIPFIQNKLRKKYTRACLGVDCNRTFETKNPHKRLCKSCVENDVYRYGQSTRDDFSF